MNGADLLLPYQTKLGAIEQGLSTCASAVSIGPAAVSKCLALLPGRLRVASLAPVKQVTLHVGSVLRQNTSNCLDLLHLAQ